MLYTEPILTYPLMTIASERTNLKLGQRLMDTAVELVHNHGSLITFIGHDPLTRKHLVIMGDELYAILIDYPTQTFWIMDMEEWIESEATRISRILFLRENGMDENG